MSILVTGGAGYIGSVVTEELQSDGFEVVVVDNLQKGHKEAISPGVQFVQADINDGQALDEIFRKYKIEAVMHMAGETEVETSMKNPRIHYKDNVSGGLNLLDAMLRNNVNKIVFSSSAAIYGEPRTVLIQEAHPQNPVNVYGDTKLIFERALGWYKMAYGLSYVCLRYFNAAGASLQYGEDHYPETHLIPRVIRAAQGKDLAINVFGEDYPTRDGSCIRDYVHVIDIARAHILAFKRMDRLSGKAFNLGSGEGYSVKEVIEAVSKASGKSLDVKICGRRAGDPAILVASSQLAREELGWQPKYSSLEIIAGSAWRWRQEHPEGYKA